MKLLLDTNVLIPGSASRDEDIRANSDACMELQRLALLHSIPLFLHPQQLKDVVADNDESRRRATLLQMKRFLSLEQPAEVDECLQDEFRVAGKRNDKVDIWLIDALLRNAVDFLVSEDTGLQRRAQRVGVGDRVVEIGDAILMLSPKRPTPSVGISKLTNVSAYLVNSRDPIWDSFRGDYQKFDVWLEKCRKEHRPTWVIEAPDGRYEGVMILNIQQTTEYGLPSPHLKICSLKVAPSSSQQRLGELLLRNAFQFSATSRLRDIAITTRSSQTALISLLEAQGFKILAGVRAEDDIVLHKRLGTDEPLSNLKSFIEFGPFELPDSETNYIVPVQPQWLQQLFPELRVQKGFAAMEDSFAHGNALRKAYLSKSKINLPVQGDTLFFYASRGNKSVVAAGVVEHAMRSSDVNELLRFTRLRTVYSAGEIGQLATRGALAIQFRQAIPNGFPIRLESCGIPIPQSIFRLSKEQAKCLRSQLTTPY